jgi:hypothetical protein
MSPSVNEAETDMPPRTSEQGTWVAGGSAAVGLGAAVVAAVAGLCCIGPITVALLGAGGAVAAAGLKPYRLPLLLASAVFLAVGYWRVYWPAPTVAGAACPIRGGRYVRAALWGASAMWVMAATLMLVA